MHLTSLCPCHCSDFMCGLYTPEFLFYLFQIQVIYSLHQGLTPIDFWHSAIPFAVTKGPTPFLFCARQRSEFSADYLNIHTKYVLAQSLDANQILVSLLFHLWSTSFVSCLHCKPQNFRLIFFKIHTTHSLDQGQMPIHFWRSAFPFFSTRGPS